MNPQLSPNELRAYELIDSSTEDDQIDGQNPYQTDEGERYFQRLIEYLNPTGEDFESLFDIYIRSRAERRELGVIGDPWNGDDPWSYEDDGDLVMDG